MPRTSLLRLVGATTALLLGSSLSNALAAQGPLGAGMRAPWYPRPWVETFGGSAADVVIDAAPDAAGGFFVAGITHSFGQGGGDAWVARIDARGNALWELAIGGPTSDEVRAIAATADGGCVLAGHTRSFGAGGTDGWIVKLAGDGTLQWQQTYGTAGDESFASIAVIRGGPAAGGYYVGGTAELGATGRDAWILALDGAGTPVWQRTYAGKLDDDVTALAATSGGLVFVANSNSSLGAAGPGIPFFRPWIVALDGDGQPTWQRTLDFSGGDTLVDVLPLAEGGFVLTGEIVAMGFFRGDVWVVRLDPQGDLVWDTRIGDNLGVNFVDSGRKVGRTPSGGFLVAGSTGTAGAGSEDLWVLRLSSTGTLLSGRTLGGVGYDGGNALVVTPTGEALVGGFAQAPNLGSLDVFLAYLSPSAFLPGGASCLPPSPTGPHVWTSPLTVTVPSVAPSTSTVVPASSAALAVGLATGSYICN